MKRRIKVFLLTAPIAAAIMTITGLYFTTDAQTVWASTHIAPLATLRAPRDAALRFEIGNYYFGGGGYDTTKAVTHFRAALVLDPMLEGPHYQLARIHFVQGDFYKATYEIDQEILLHPDFKRSHYVRGLIYGYSGRLKEAEAEFKAFLAWKPESWAGNNDLAWIYFQEGKYREARDAARAGLIIAPDNPWLLNSLGVALLNTNDKEGAKETFDRALSVLDSMTEADWGVAYPGNDPGIYAEGFSKMKESIEENLKLLGAGDIGNPS